jgi:hypothetical protein
MVVLDKALFTGQEGVCEEEIVNGEVTNWRESTDKALRKFQWHGGAVACIGLSLTPDNRRVQDGILVTRGKLENVECTMEAKKVWWEAAPGTTITIRLESVDAFQFPDGGLYSEYLCAENVTHFFHTTEEDRSPRPVLTAKLPELGIGSFCLRMICQISKSSSSRTGIWLKYTVMIFPEKKEVLLENEMARQPGWPGLKVHEGEMAILPRPTVAWQCPVLPLLRTGQPFDQLPEAPSAAEMRRAIGAIMSKSYEPKIYQTPGSVINKWDKINRNPEELINKAGPVSWPRQPEPERTTGT